MRRMDDSEIEEGAPAAGSDADSSGDEQAVELSAADEKAIMRLEAALRTKPGAYNLHVQMIALLRQCRLWAKLEEARVAMAARLPLTGDMWLQWTADVEARYGNEPDDEDEFNERVEALYERAVGDYLCVPIWLAYLQFVMAQQDPPADPARVRSLYERALAVGGHHCTEGPALWRAAIDYERGIVTASHPGESESTAAVLRLRGLYQRRVGIPHAGGENDLAEYASFEDVPPHVIAAAASAVSSWAARVPHEAALAAASGQDGSPPDQGAYRSSAISYTKLEESSGDPSRAACAHERTIAAIPHDPTLWLRYSRYLDGQQQVESCTQVLARAVRDCPESGAVWAAALRHAERTGATADHQAALYDRALGAPVLSPADLVDIVLTRGAALRRLGPAAAAQMRDAFTRGEAVLAAAAGPLLHQRSDSSEAWPADRIHLLLAVPSARARAEAVHLGDAPTARAVWESVIKDHSWLADAWAGYIALERQLGATRQARALYRRCYARKLETAGGADGVELMCTSWLAMERDDGAAADYADAAAKVDPILETLRSAKAQAIAAASVPPAAPLSRADMVRMRREKDPNYRGNKGNDHAAAAARGGEGPPSRKRELGSAAREGGEGAKRAKRTEGGIAAGTSSTVDNGGSNAAPPSTAEHSPREAGATPVVFLDVHTAFVKNLRANVLEPELEALFGPCGSLKAVRMPREAETGRPRGVAYVEFGDEASLKAALALDGTEVKGKRISVMISRPPGRSQDGGGPRPNRGRGRGGFGPGMAAPPRAPAVRLQGSSAAFVPRTVRAHVAAQSEGNEAADEGGGVMRAVAPAPMSNDEFRKMLFSKKPAS